MPFVRTAPCCGPALILWERTNHQGTKDDEMHQLVFLVPWW